MPTLVRRCCAVLVALLVAVSSVVTPAGAANLSATELKARVLYFQQAGRTTDRDIALAQLTATDAFDGGLWQGLISTWDGVNHATSVNMSTPSGLPTKGHVFIVLGAAGAAQRERRLKAVLPALVKYPTSKVLVTGGPHTVNGKTYTEGGVMRDWLVAHKVSSKRILVEKTAASTVTNATKSMAMLAASDEYSSYTLVSDAPHLKRATVLFDAAVVQIEEKLGHLWAMRRVSEIGAPFSSATASAAVIAEHTAKVFGIYPSYAKVLGSPPAKAVLTGLKLTAPTKLAYSVGQTLATKGLVVTAVYGNVSGTRVVTGSAKITGFSSAKVAKPTVTVSYTEGSVTKTATFATSVTKAASSLNLKLSTTKVKAYRTKVVAKATVAASANLAPTGSVSFFLDGKLRRTVKLSGSGVASFTYPRLKHLGKRSVSVKYSGNAVLNAAGVKVTLTVSR